MIFRCPDCDFHTEKRTQYAGHRSGHVRRNEVKKRPATSSDHCCKHCGDIFESGPKLAGHLTKHRPRQIRAWDELTTHAQRKQRLLSERGHQCEKCRNTHWQDHIIPLELDHIDGNNEHNEKSNLRLLCPNCHALTPTYKGRNIGKHKTRSSAYRRAYRIRTLGPIAQVG